MKKVIVIGCPGSGKSMFSRALHKITGLPLYHLDMIYWHEDKSVLSREELIERINEIGATDKWIMDGNYGGTMELRMSLCDTIIFLDYPTDVCLEGIMARRGTQRPDMPWRDSDEPDTEFIDSVKNYNTLNRPKVLERIKKFSGKKVFIFKNRNESEIFLDSIRNVSKSSIMPDSAGGNMVIHPIPPVYDSSSSILILGSFPSVKSRECGFFYGHKQNRFWRVIAGIYGIKAPETIESKKKMLLDHNIALWDVIKSCEISGSADSSIKNVVPNDICSIIEESKITKIFTNGKKADTLYKKYLEDKTGIKAVCLPSTSPANASKSAESLIEEWKIIRTA